MKPEKNPSAAEQVQLWNLSHHIGTAVRYRPTSGEAYEIHTRTIGRASVMGGVAVVKVDKTRFAVALSCLTVDGG